MSANIYFCLHEEYRDATMATFRDTPRAAEGRGGWTRDESRRREGCRVVVVVLIGRL